MDAPQFIVDSKNQHVYPCTDYQPADGYFSKKEGSGGHKFRDFHKIRKKCFFTVIFGHLEGMGGHN